LAAGLRPNPLEELTVLPQTQERVWIERGGEGWSGI